MEGSTEQGQEPSGPGCAAAAVGRRTSSAGPLRASTGSIRHRRAKLSTSSRRRSCSAWTACTTSRISFHNGQVGHRGPLGTDDRRHPVGGVVHGRRRRRRCGDLLGPRAGDALSYAAFGEHGTREFFTRALPQARGRGDDHRPSARRSTRSQPRRPRCSKAAGAAGDHVAGGRVGHLRLQATTCTGLLGVPGQDAGVKPC
jgi:hypothetical protein